MRMKESLLGRQLPGYAPKEVQERQQIDIRSDIYSFGVTFYVVLHQSFPKQEIKVHGHLDHLLLKCCADKPNDRFRAISDVQKAFHGHRKLMKVAVSFILCLFVLGVIFLNKWETTMETVYQQNLKNGFYEEAIAMYPQRIQGYEQVYVHSDDPREGIWKVEALMKAHHQEKNEKVCYYIALCCLLQDRSYYHKAAVYLEKLSDSSEYPYAKEFQHIAEELTDDPPLKTELAIEVKLYQLFLRLDQTKESIEVDRVLALYQNHRHDLSAAGLEQLKLVIGKTLPYTKEKSRQEELQELRGECEFQQGSQYYEQGDFKNMEQCYHDAEKSFKNAVRSDHILSCLAIIEIARAEADSASREQHLHNAESYSEEMSEKQRETVQELKRRIALLRKGGS